MAYPPLVLVKFKSTGKTVAVSPGTSLLEAARRAGISLPATCGGQCECGECRIVVQDGMVSTLTRDELEVLNDTELIQGMRLACCVRVYSSAIIDS